MADNVLGPRKWKQFIKSSVDNLGDPVFLTFDLDFFSIVNEHPFGDGLLWQSLFMPDRSHRIKGDGRNDLINRFAGVEWSAYDWLMEYGSPWKGVSFNNSISAGIQSAITPASASDLFTANEILREIQSQPWYFQSISGVDQLWKSMSRVKEGNKPVEITIGCLESITQPLTRLAQHYRSAIYDGDRLCYNLPDNLRTFNLAVTLYEVRDLIDNSKRLYSRDRLTPKNVNTTDPGNFKYLENGLHQVRFILHRCEFDFNDSMGGAGTEYKAYTQDKPFDISFKIKAQWVTEEATSSVIDDYHTLGIFQGAADSLEGRFNRMVQSALGLPGRLLGNLSNQVQTAIENVAIGNVYDRINEVGDANQILGRRSPVGPAPASNVGDTIGGYGGTAADPVVKDLGKVY